MYENVKKNLKADLISGLVVSLVALPLCLGIALASGAPLFTGLFAGVIGGLIVGMASDSQLGVSGPAAGLAVIVEMAIIKLGFESFAMAVLIAGIFQFVAGQLKAGVISHFFPTSVVKGMLSGIGLILILKQFPHALGFDTSSYIGELEFFEKMGENTFTSIIHAFSNIKVGAIIIIVASFGVIFLIENRLLKEKIKILKSVPSPLVVILVGVFLNFIFKQFFPGFYLGSIDLEGGSDVSHLVTLPKIESWEEFKSLIPLPHFKSLLDINVWKVGITLFLVASLESLLSLEATDKLDPYKRHSSSNQELVAQGLGNIVAGFLGVIPVTQVIVRSATNINSGGKTKMATIIHGCFLLIFIFLIPDLINMIPLASLAVILIVVGYKLASFKVIKEQWHLGMVQFIPYMVTVLGLVFTDMLTGIALGMSVAIFQILKVNYRRPFSDYKKSKDEKSVIIYLPVQLNYLNAVSFSKFLNSIEPGYHVTIEGKKNEFLSTEVLESVYDFQENCELKKITLEVKNLSVFNMRHENEEQKAA
jgi:MFS superfamily sulfate permease-like transporter